MGDLSIVIILGLDGTKMTRLVTSVAHIGRRLDPCALFPFKTRADTVAFMARPALGITDDEFVTGIGLFTAEAVNAEVIRVIEASPVPGIDPSVPEDLF